MKNSFITLMTDFGTTDHYVAAMKGCILGICPGANLIDVTHNVPPQDVEAASFLLEQYWNDFPENTIHLCIVDPGVGGIRKPVAVYFEKRIFVGPDNGIMTNLIQKNHRWKARVLDNDKYHCAEISNTFHGRDIFAPVAAHLAAGASFDDLGTPEQELVLNENQPVLMGTQKLNGRIVHIDSFGNLITNIRRNHLEWAKLNPEDAGLQIGPHTVGRYVSHYQEADDDPVMLFGSSGLLEIAIRNDSAQKRFGIRKGAEVNVMKVDKLLSI